MLLFRSKYPFSRKKHPITAALEEMYMQVSVNPEDRKSLRVLWEAEESELPKYIRFVFGAKFSPTWAIYPLRTCAGKMLKTIRPSAKTCQRERRYGRILQVTDDIDTAVKVVEGLRQVLQQKSFNLTR